MRAAKVYIRGELINLHGYFVDENGNVFYNGLKQKQYLKSGYKFMRIPINGVLKNIKVHRIVASSFPEICGDFNEVVNHLDEDKLNNQAQNLKWTTNSENLSWGNIEEKRRLGADIRSNIIRSVKSFCNDNGIEYSPIKITKLKTMYKAKGKDFILYMDFDYNVNDKKSKYDKVIVKEPVLSEPSLKCTIKDAPEWYKHFIEKLYKFPEEIENFRDVISLY